MASRVVGGACVVALGLCSAAADAQAVGTRKPRGETAAAHRNLSEGGALRPGVYGRVALRADLPPPAVIYPHPVRASGERIPVQARPVYLYVPPGQVRRWTQHCAKWQACDEPVLFVRMDASPSQWGGWKVLRGQEVAAAP